jgi:selenocysteine-specific elongation factor
MGAIVGTAGHVDHGKTELVKALTGVDTDRWEEEKRRGLTIDLGFAPLDLPESGRVGLIDVPGHQDFLRNMLAGMGGVDVAVLVVAADEGVMPQTKEHFNIVRFFGVRKMVVAVTKCDLVEDEIAELVGMDIRAMLEASRFEKSPLVKVSSTKRTGLDELKHEIDSAVMSLPEKDYTKPARLPVDRVFVLKGVGTVVTGTLVSGKVSQGSEVAIYPKGIRTRIRQIHVHNEKKDEGLAGNRVALNLTGVSKDDIERGDLICAPGCVEPSVMFDARLEVGHDSLPLKDWTRVKIYIGTGELLARVAILGRKEIEPGNIGYVQLRLEQKSVASFGDRFVARSYSPMAIIGGGVILDSNPRKHRRSDEVAINILEARASGDAGKIVSAHLNMGSVDIAALKRSIDVNDKEFTNAIEAAIREGRAEKLGGAIFDKSYLTKTRSNIYAILEEYHKENPLKTGLSKEELRVRLKMAQQTFDEFLSKSGDIEIVGDRVKLRKMKLEMTQGQEKERNKIEKIFLDAVFSPPSKDEVVSKGSRQLFYSLIDSGVLVKVSQDILIHKDVLENGKADIERAVKQKGPLKLTEIKDILKTTRKFAVPIAEYFDRIGFTKREGDLRILA